MYSGCFSRRRFVASGALLGLLPLRFATASPECVRVATNILGPAYRAGAPLRTRLCEPGEPGTPLTMRGRISDAASCAPLRDALLDVWQVDANAHYDMDSPAFHLRGKFRTGRNGAYAFDTIRPVHYGTRPKHIHFLITRDGYEPRITQCYFAGDPRNSTDPFVKRELIITPAGHAAAKGALTGVFDVALEREHPVSAGDLRAYRDYVGAYQVAPGMTVACAGTSRANASTWMPRTANSCRARARASSSPSTTTT